MRGALAYVKESPDQNRQIALINRPKPHPLALSL